MNTEGISRQIYNMVCSSGKGETVYVVSYTDTKCVCMCACVYIKHKA